MPFTSSKTKQINSSLIKPLNLPFVPLHCYRPLRLRKTRSPPIFLSALDLSSQLSLVRTILLETNNFIWYKQLYLTRKILFDRIKSYFKKKKNSVYSKEFFLTRNRTLIRKRMLSKNKITSGELIYGIGRKF